MDRRNFFTAIAASAATPLIANGSTPPVPDDAGGFLAFRINIGRLPPCRAEAYINRLKKQFLESMARHGSRKWETWWFPTRNGPTDVRVYLRQGTERTLKELEPLYLDFYEERPSHSSLIKPTREYVLLMLGDPVIKVELDDSQLNMTVNLAIEAVESHLPNALVPNGWYIELVRMGALAKAKMVLGRIRRQHGDCENQLDGATLLKEGNDEHKEWLSLVMPQKDRRE